MYVQRPEKKLAAFTTLNSFLQMLHACIRGKLHLQQKRSISVDLNEIIKIDTFVLIIDCLQYHIHQKAKYWWHDTSNVLAKI